MPQTLEAQVMPMPTRRTCLACPAVLPPLPPGPTGDRLKCVACRLQGLRDDTHEAALGQLLGGDGPRSLPTWVIRRLEFLDEVIADLRAQQSGGRHG